MQKEWLRRKINQKNGFLTDKEKEQLLQQLEDTVYEVENEKTKVDDLTNEVEN